MFSLACIILPILRTQHNLSGEQAGGRIVEIFQLSSTLSDVEELLVSSAGRFFRETY